MFMNKQYLKRKKYFLQEITFFVSMAYGICGWSQVQNNGTIRIQDNTSFCISSGNLVFGTAPGKAETSRTASGFGKFIFDVSAGSNGAANTHYVDGYVSTLGNSNFLCPVGQSNIYAPAKINSAVADIISVAYVRSAATAVGSLLDDSVSAVSGLEYWIVSGSNQAIVSLSWRSSSNISTLTSANIANLVIAGWNGSKWIQIGSAIDAVSITGGASTFISGSISTSANVGLAGFTTFTLAKKGECEPLVASSGITRTWTGSWSGGIAPTLADAAVISAAYSGSLSCNSLVLNANVTLTGTNSLELVNSCSGNGKIVMSSEASFLQRNNTGTAPTIELTKTTRSMKQYDYVYFGSPVVGNVFSQLAGAKAQTAVALGAFDLKYKYQSGAGGGWQALSSTTVGSGFIMRVQPVAPFLTTTASDKIDVKFSGIANNGDISVNILQNAALPEGGTSHNLLSNPYPSAIDGDLFLRKNTAIDGVIYVWQQSTPAGNSAATTYFQADYLAYTLAGSVANSAIAGTFNGKIATGQSFKVKALNSTNVIFTNCMRVLNNNSNFYRQSNLSASAGNDKFKLNMTGGSGNVFSQILISYQPEGTLGYDRTYDAGRNSVSSSQLYSFLDATQQKLAINARPLFSNTDVIQIGLSKQDSTVEQYSISIGQLEGVFANGQSVFIHDKVLNVFHNLNQGAYQFSVNGQSVDTRFEIVYQNSALGTQNFANSNCNSSIKNEMLYVNANRNIANITVFDITGKKIADFKINNSKEFSSDFNFAEGIYIAKIKLDTDEIVSQKLINIK